DRAHLVIGRRLHRYLPGLNLERFGDVLPHPFDELADFRLLEHDGRVDINDLEMMFSEELPHMLEENNRGNPGEPGVGVGKMLSDVPQRCRPQERVGDRMAEHVGIRMPYQPFHKRNLHSPSMSFRLTTSL